VIFGGEALQIESLRPWFARYGDQRPQLVNMYGITETTVHVTYRPLALADLKRGQNSVIGLPIPDLQCYVLDELGQPVPIGVAGELYVGGLGLARGYWQRGDITAERFLPHPFSDTPGARLYRTGDLVRYSIAGELEYLGRVDQQVKLRGFRIELGEIEAALNQHAMIRENVVIIGEDQAGDKCLIAYLVTHDRENQPAIKTLRLFLQNQLPAYMVPSHFVFLDKLPLTANKKIDRRALPAPMGSQHELDTEYVAPRNEIEQTLAAIWQEVLGVEQIGIHDNFFERGGNSLVSMQILMKTHLAGIDVNLKQYFQYQTIAELAEKIASERDKEHEQTDIVIVQAEQGLVTGPLPFTSGQRWLLHEKETSNSHLNSVYTLDVQRPLNFAILNQTLQILQRHHDMLRLRLTRDETGWRQTIIEAMDSLPYIRFDFSHLTPAEQKRAVNTISSQLHIDLNHFEGSFLRMAYFDFGPQRPAQLFLIINHFVTDHTSSFILLQDFQTVYQQIEEERAISLPPKTVSFQHWARRVDEYLHSEELRHELEHYWLALPWGDVPPLPIDYPEGMAKNTLSLSRLVKMSLSTEETSLLQQCLNNDIQILDILLGALAYTLSKWIESPIMSVLAQYHGRQNVFDGFDLSRTFGYVAFGRYLFFDMNEATTVIEAFQQTREQLHHLPHQGIGLDMLMQLGNEEIKEKLKKVRHPEVVFNFTGIALQASGPSLFLPAQETPDETTKTDVYRNYKLHCGGEIVDGQLWITWEYGSKIHKRTTIETLGQTYMQTLKKLIAYLSGKE
jgi:non-ribosomal peptide synthase protein (TIGR01720 family)